MNLARPAIPEAIKREVRQRCFFGCVICGAPVFDYDHIQEYATVKEHTASNLTLLCPNHHRDKTSGRLSADFIRDSNGKPFNATKPTTAPYAIMGARSIELIIGSNNVGVTGSGIAILVNGGTFLRFDYEGEWMVLSGVITNQNGDILFRLKYGEIQASTSVWDVSYIGSRLMMKSSAGKIVLDITLTNEALTVDRGAFVDRRDGTGFLANPTELVALIGGNKNTTLKGMRMIGVAGAAFAVGNTDIDQYNAVWQP